LAFLAGAFFREPQATHRNESSRQEQRPIDSNYFFLAFAVFLAAGFLHREQKATGINRSRLREQRPTRVYFFLQVFLQAGFLAFAVLLEALQNFT
jgi:hypothetical protein